MPLKVDMLGHGVRLVDQRESDGSYWDTTAKSCSPQRADFVAEVGEIDAPNLG